MPNKNNFPKKQTLYLPEYCEQVKEFMRTGKSFTAFCGHIGFSTSTVKDWRKANPEFDEACRVASHLSQAWWEGEVMDNLVHDKDIKVEASLINFQLAGRFRDYKGNNKEEEQTTDEAKHLTIEGMDADKL